MLRTCYKLTLKSDKLPFFSSIFELGDGEKAAEFSCVSVGLGTDCPPAAQKNKQTYTTQARKQHNKQERINKENTSMYKNKEFVKMQT